MEGSARNSSFCNVKRENTIQPQVHLSVLCSWQMAVHSHISSLVLPEAEHLQKYIISCSHVHPWRFPPGAEQAGTISLFLTPVSWANAIMFRHLGHSSLAQEK